MYTYHASSKHKAFSALVLPILDYASTVWNPHSQKNIQALEKSKIMVLAGFVEADSTLKLLYGQSPPMTAVMSSIDHHFQLVESTYLSVAIMYDILHQNIS